MEYFSIQQKKYEHCEYPSFIGVEGKDILLGKSDRYHYIDIKSEYIKILSKNGSITHEFLNGNSIDGKFITKVEPNNNNKYLLWFVWIGSSDITMLIQSIKSYILVGEYTGDIIVLTDLDYSPNELNSFQQVRFLKINPKKRLGKIILNRLNIFCLKPLIHEYIDISKYDFIFYSDADILCVTPCIMPLLNSMNDKSVIWYSKDNGCVGNRWACSGLGILTENEIVKNNNFSVNAGWFMVPNNDVGISFLNRWSEIQKQHDYEADDQGILYALFIREHINKKLAIGIVSAYNGYSWKPMQSESHIIHFYGHERYLQTIIYKEIMYEK